MKVLLSTVASVGVVVLTAFCSLAEGSRSLGDLTGPWELMVDDHLVESRQNLVRRYHAFQKYPGNPVLKPDRPWEGQVAYLFGSVLPAENGEGYRMWYHTADADAPPEEQYRNLYAESPDGIVWHKPDLGIVEYRGSRNNNIFLERMRESHLPLVIHTPWETDPEKTYKLVYYDFGRTDTHHSVSGYYGAWSRDGIHWSDTRAEPLLADPGDVGNFVWDPHRKRYLGYAKIWVASGGFMRRAIGMTSTTDFLHWPPTQLVLAPDAVDDRWITKDRQHTDFYGLSGFAYESMYLGFLWVFRIEDGDNDGTIHLELVSSRDGLRWKREEGDRPPILELGRAGAFDDGMLHTPTQPILGGGTLKLFYGASDQTHVSEVAGGWGNCAIGLATLRKDGFASLEAGADPGILTTRALLGLEGRLRINADASRGSIRVEVLNEAGEVVPGYGRDQCEPIRGDGIDQTVRWQERDRLPSGAGFYRLRFLLQDAALYAFRAAEPVGPGRVRPLLDVHLDFEGDRPTAARDKGVGDGLQEIRFHNSVEVIQDESAVSGSGVAAFTGDGKSHDALEIVGTRHLGSRFILSARVRPSQKRRMRLFSNHRGTGEPTAGELIFDFNPLEGELRFVYNGQSVVSRSSLILSDRYHHMEAAYDLGRVRLYLDGNLVGEGLLRPGTTYLFYNRSVVRHLADSDSEPPIGVYLTSDLRVGQDLEGRFVTYRDEEQSSPRNQFTGWIDEFQISRLPDGTAADIAASSGGLIKDVGPIRRYGTGGAWTKGGWARSFLDSDGTLYLQGHKKSLDGGRSFLPHTGPSLEEILLIPEGVIHRKKGLFLALDGPVEFVSPGYYKVRAWRSMDGLRTLQEEEAVLRVPDGPRRARKAGHDLGDEWFGLYLYRDVVEKPDGTLLTTIEGNLHTDILPPTDRESVTETLFRQRTFVVSSTDDGRSWDYLSTVAVPRAGDPAGEGFTEPAILHLGEGRLLCVMRTGNFTPMFASWSDDWGKTWSEPVYTGLDRGLDPKLLKLRDGRVLLSYGLRFPAGTRIRPRKRGALIRFALSEDGGRTWESATVAEGMGSNYSSVFELEPNLILCQVDGWVWQVQLRPRHR